mgnify:CR=1 FL=1
MQRLADMARSEIALGTRDRHNMLYIEHCPCPQPIVSDLDMGSRIPLATTAPASGTSLPAPPKVTRWEDTGMKPVEAREWQNYGFNPQEGMNWHSAGFEPVVARTWSDKGFDAAGFVADLRQAFAKAAVTAIV